MVDSTLDHRLALLRRAASPGRVRAAAVELIDGVLASPDRPGAVLSGGLRAARHLHSAERRLVGDGVRAVIRLRVLLADLIGPAGTDRWWVAWLLTQGLPLPEAIEALGAGDEPEVAGALGRLAAGSGDPQALCADPDPIAALACTAGASRALAGELLASLGERAWPFVAASAERAPLDLRVNVARCTVTAAAAALREQGIETAPIALAPHGLRVAGGGNIVGSRAFQRGLVDIQDAGSQILAELVQPRAGELVVDFCAGAGGKALALAAEAPGARILATDVRRRALDELGRRARRAGADAIRAVQLQRDGTWPDGPVGKADRVLVDAPCSGTGTLRRHPEHLLRLDAQVIGELPGLQREILDRAAALVRPGGRLVYGTCSVLKRENDDVIREFLTRHPDFVEVPLPGVLGRERASRLGGERLRLAPHTQGFDGFFGCVLERRV